MTQKVDRHSLSSFILYIDNIHDVIGLSSGGSAAEGLDLSDVLVEALSANMFTLICSTDPINYSRYIENTSFGNIVKKIDIKEPETNEAIQIIEGKVGAIEGKNNVFFSYDALDKAVTLTGRYVHDYFLPYKAIHLLVERAPQESCRHPGTEILQLRS